VDLNLLLVLRMLLETASVSETARRLNSTQPSISRMLDRLRRELGDPLLVKSSNAMIRTARANALQPVLNQLLELLQTVYQTPADYQLAHERRTCVIGANDSLQAIFAAPLITTLRELAPHAQVRFKPVPYPNMLRSLLDGEVDLLLAMTEEEDPAFRSRALFRSGFCCMCSVDNPAVGATTSIGAIAALPYLDVSHMGQVSAMTQAIFLAAGHRKNTVAAMSSFLAAPSVIAGSQMVCLVPSYLAPTLGLDKGVRLVALTDETQRHTVRMIWHNTTHFDAFMDTVRSLLHANASRVSGEFMAKSA
jgi:LysR family transcriptional activator of mexEF-oprN operon